MKAVVYEGPRSFEIKTVDTPRPGPHEVLLRVLMAGVCGTDLHLHDGEFGPTYPLIPGHEFVGEIEEVGSAVSGLSPGQRVVVDNTRQCGECVNCRRRRANFCLNLVAQGVNAPGGFAEYICAPAGRCFVVDDLPVEVAVLTEPTACVVHGLDRLNPAPGSEVAVFGAGPTGLLLAQFLAASGGTRVTVAAPTAFKLKLAAAWGADVTVELDRSRPERNAELLRAASPDGFDMVVDATGATAVLDQVIELTRDGGTVVTYGMAPEAATWNISPYEIFRRELTIIGSFAQCYSFDRALLALRTGRIKTDGMITHRFTLDEYADALTAVAGSSCLKAVIVP
ncbi:zinc-dependent alcohol dehydrogenase family protein [Sphaerisporangium sp. NPDC088356]|uniref:zinc-dependent alcohol dehydrogenase family protein n=1 Tax=Sphaerisporangium sp. NPDC088356 TaxID=3154871 RepID=UPI003447363E